MFERMEREYTRAKHATEWAAALDGRLGQSGCLRALQERVLSASGSAPRELVRCWARAQALSTCHKSATRPARERLSEQEAECKGEHGPVQLVFKLASFARAPDAADAAAARTARARRAIPLRFFATWLGA